MCVYVVCTVTIVKQNCIHQAIRTDQVLKIFGNLIFVGPCIIVITEE